jgi:hypothetical protein
MSCISQLPAPIVVFLLGRLIGAAVAPSLRERRFVVPTWRGHSLTRVLSGLLDSIGARPGVIMAGEDAAESPPQQA